MSADLVVRVAGRPVTLHRFPEGVGGPHFFQTRVPPHPAWVRTVMTFRTQRQGVRGAGDRRPAVAGLGGEPLDAGDPPVPRAGRGAGTAAGEVFDLDPGEPAGMREACAVALRVRDVLAADGLESWPKSSGAKGVHVYVPLAGATYDVTKAYAKRVAGLLTRETPGLVVERMTRSLRPGKVLVDWSQNDMGKSTVAPYTLRALRVPSVSMPVTWDEVAAGAGGDLSALFWPPAAALDRLAGVGDLFAPVLHNRQRLRPQIG